MRYKSFDVFLDVRVVSLLDSFDVFLDVRVVSLLDSFDVFLDVRVLSLLDSGYRVFSSVFPKTTPSCRFQEIQIAKHFRISLNNH